MEPTQLRDDDGVSLVEVLVAMLIFAILMIGLIPVMVQSLQLTSTSASTSSAARVASAQIEAARTLQLPISDDPLCTRFLEALDAELAKPVADRAILTAVASDGRGDDDLTVEHTAACDAADTRAASYRVKVLQGSKVLSDMATEIWLDD